MVASRVLYRCEICGNEYDDLATAEKCENQPLAPIVQLPVGTVVRLDARSLKDGPAYVVARVTGYVIKNWFSTYIGHHAWFVALDREVHLSESWDDDYHRTTVEAKKILPEDLTLPREEDYYKTPLDAVWEDVSERHSEKVMWMQKDYPDDRPEDWKPPKQKWWET